MLIGSIGHTRILSKRDPALTGRNGRKPWIAKSAPSRKQDLDYSPEAKGEEHCWQQMGLPHQTEGRRHHREVQGAPRSAWVHAEVRRGLFRHLFPSRTALASFRTILAYAACNDWDIDTFDFNGAYLNGELSADEDIYMQSPPGYDNQGESVKHLCKSLYGLKQAGRKWYDTLYRALTGEGFHVNAADPGVFFARNNEQVTILAIHVDDCMITGSSGDLISEYKQRLHSRYSLTDLGPIHWLLGIKITCDREARTISLSQTSYINTILSRFSLSNAKPVASPITPGAIYSKTDTPSDATQVAHMKKTPYREAVGSLMYAAVATRPDITFAISTLSQFLDNLGEIHWEAVKRVFRYLAGTKTHCAHLWQRAP
jgi:hypothetical protein